MTGKAEDDDSYDPSAIWDEYKKDPLAELDLEHLREYYRMKMQKILRKYKSLHDGTLEEVVYTEHVIDFIEGAKQVLQLHYRAGLGSCKVVKYHAEKIMKLGVIELETKPWASPVVLMLKKDGTYLLCVD